MGFCKVSSVHKNYPQKSLAGLRFNSSYFAPILYVRELFGTLIKKG